MGFETPKMPSPEEMAKIEKERALSEEEIKQEDIEEKVEQVEEEEKPPEEREEKGITRREFFKRTLERALGAAAYFYFPQLFGGTSFEGMSEEETKERITAEDFGTIRKESIHRLQENVGLREEIGQEGIDKLVEIILRINPDEINRDIAQWVNLPKGVLDREKIQSLNVLSDREWEESKIFSDSAVVLPGDKMFIRASRCLEKGQINELRFNHIFTHEYFHILTTDSELPSGTEIPWMDEYSLPADFYEGATELINLLYLQKKGLSVERYGYPIGNTLTAFYVHQLAGGETFVRDYFTQSIDNIQKNFDKKLGQDQFELIMGKEKGVLGLILSEMDDLDTLHRLIKLSKEKDIDYESILKKAGEIGISERVRLIKSKKGKGEIEGLTSFFENAQDNLVSRGVLVSYEILPINLPYRIYLGQRGSLPTEAEILGTTSVIKHSIEFIERMRQQYDEKKFEEYIKKDYERTDGSFNYKPIKITPFIEELMDDYRLEKDPDKKMKIEIKIHQKIEEVGRIVIEKIKNNLDH